MSKMKEWLLDNQLNGDDGSGFEDYPIYCGDCLVELSRCAHASEYKREKAGK